MDFDGVLRILASYKYFLQEAVMTVIQDEVDRNYEAFAKILPSIMNSHLNKYALMKNEKILGYYSTAEDARIAADSFIDDKLFSIQLVSNISLDLGFYTHAVVVN